jgi:hypothetical protein
MTSIELTRFLIYSAFVNYIILIVWFLAFLTAHDWLYRLHARWFKLAPESFDAIHYGGMAVYKIGILLFNLAPLFAFTLVKQ